jgi:hypothetical protein
VRKALYLLFALLLLTSCGGKKGELRISGEFKNLKQADFFLFSEEGYMESIDTIHVRNGKFDYRLPLTADEASFTLVYPNFSTLDLFGGSGQHIRIEGDARSLSEVRVEGGRVSEEFKTEFYIRRERGRNLLEKGKKLTPFKLVTRKGDTIRRDQYRGQWLLIAFWADWCPGSSSATHEVREFRKRLGDKSATISYSLDTDTFILSLDERRDSIIWPSVCDRLSWCSPLVQTLGIRELPFFVLTDTAQRVVAFGSRWNKDIAPSLP